MPTCNKCEKDYEEVTVYVTEENKYTAYKSEKRYGGECIDWSASEQVEGTEKEADLQCPFCENTVAHWSAKDDRTMSLTEFVGTHLDVQS